MPTTVQAALLGLSKGQNRLVFQNPRGNKYYYAFYLTDDANSRLKSEWSSDGSSWGNTPDEPIGAVNSVEAIDVKIHDDGSQLVVWIAVHNGSYLYYVRGTISDAGSSITWGTPRLPGLFSPLFAAPNCCAIARTDNGRIVIAFTRDITHHGKDYRRTDLIGSNNDGDAPSWGLAVAWNDPSDNSNNRDKDGVWFGLESYSSSYPNRVFLHGRFPEGSTTVAYQVLTAVPDWNGTAFSNTTAAQWIASTEAGLVISGLVDASDIAHLIYNPISSSIVHRKAGTAGDDNLGSTTQITTTTCDATSLSYDSVNDELYAFYHAAPETTDFNYKVSAAGTISWGSEQTITYAQDVTAISTWNRDVESYLHILGSNAGGNVWYHGLNLGAEPPPTGQPTQSRTFGVPTGSGFGGGWN